MIERSYGLDTVGGGEDVRDNVGYELVVLAGGGEGGRKHLAKHHYRGVFVDFVAMERGWVDVVNTYTQYKEFYTI